MDATRDELTAREIEILRLVATGLSDKRIGVHLGIAHRTVSNHVGTVLHKLSASNRTEAVANAIRDGIIEAPLPRPAP